MIFNMAAYGTNITNDSIGETLYQDIKKISNEESIELDFSKIQTMTTFCAKQIFGRLLTEFGEDIFFKKFSFKNAHNGIRYILTIGLDSTS